MSRTLPVAVLIATTLFAIAPARALDDPMATLTFDKREVLAQYRVPSDELERLRASAAQRDKVRIGLGSFAHFYPRTEYSGDSEQTLYAGSGYDYAEDVLQGMFQAGLFPAGNLGLSNFPPVENFDYVAASEWIGTSTDLGIHYTIMNVKSNKVVFEEILPLPKEWDGSNGADLGAQSGQDSRRVRDRVMANFGRYLAYKAAAAISASIK